MLLAALLLETVLISLSGVLSPGPISAYSVGRGSRSPRAGAQIAIAHSLIEIPFLAAIFFGLMGFLQRPSVTALIAFFGGLILLKMGIEMLRDARRAGVAFSGSTLSPLAAGVVLTLSNPYFFIWWLTVGAVLITRAAAFGVLGFFAFALAHWLCDLGWYSFLGVLAYRGGKFFGQAFQRIVFVVCGGFLLFFGGKFILDSLRILSV